jgi:topoisomerase-4 subunit A
MLGADGIAVGLSTRILPHNFIELLKAQIAILEDRKFKVLPDFISGGLMDASEYNKGNGKVKVRAILEKQGDNKLVIRQIPFGTTTDSVISSIEDAVRKKKIRIRSIHDFTAGNVEIQITLSPGEKAEKAIAALYHFTQCEVSLSSNIVVISGNRPMQLTVEDVLRDNTQQLLDLLCQELELRKKKLENELHFRSLAQIFIENRIYKRIEEAGTYEKVQQEVLNGLAPFRPQLIRDVTLEDVEMLLDLRIKRISKFDIQKNRDEMARIAAELKEIEKHLEELVAYAISYLQRLIDKYKSEYKRRTKLKEAEEIDVRKLTANELAIVHDREKGFLGSEVKGDPSFRCSPLDRLVVVWNDGRYQVMPPPEKLFVDRDVLYFGIFDREKEFTVIYQTARAAFLKRFTFGGAIMNRDYNLAQDKSRIVYFSEKPAKQLRLKFRKTKGARVTEETVDMTAVPVRSARSKGNQVARKSISSVSIVN